MIKFSNYENSIYRQDRLVKTYMSFSQELREVVTSMHDYKGTLHIEVEKTFPKISKEIDEAWKAQCEYSFEIWRDGVIVCSSLVGPYPDEVELVE